MGIFNRGKKTTESGAVDTIIGGKAKFKGEMISSGSISVSGQYEGKITASGEVIIGRGSKMLGDVHAENVVISGKVDGNIQASQSLEITKSGKVNGNLEGGRIIIEEGAVYRGKVKVANGGEKEEDEKAEETVEVVSDETDLLLKRKTKQAPMF